PSRAPAPCRRRIVRQPPARSSPASDRRPLPAPVCDAFRPPRRRSASPVGTPQFQRKTVTSDLSLAEDRWKAERPRQKTLELVFPRNLSSPGRTTASGDPAFSREQATPRDEACPPEIARPHRYK